MFYAFVENNFFVLFWKRKKVFFFYLKQYLIFKSDSKKSATYQLIKIRDINTFHKEIIHKDMNLRLIFIE